MKTTISCSGAEITENGAPLLQGQIQFFESGSTKLVSGWPLDDNGKASYSLKPGTYCVRIKGIGRDIYGAPMERFMTIDNFQIN